MFTYKVKKALNNNVLIAMDKQDAEVVLIGKGIGFHHKQGDLIRDEVIEKLFVLRDKKEQAHYKELLPHIDQTTLQTIIAATELIRKKSNTVLNEHTHVALTDHLIFVIHRLSRGFAITNPFLSETKVLYPFEYKIATEVVDFINKSIEIQLPEGEIGFIALHVHSAIVNKDVSEVNRYSQLIGSLVTTIESKLQVIIDKESIDYIRLVQHLQYTIERVINDEVVEKPESIALLLKEEYPICYNLAWQLMKIMQQSLKKQVYDAEAVYLTMHLQRLAMKHTH